MYNAILDRDIDYRLKLRFLRINKVFSLETIFCIHIIIICELSVNFSIYKVFDLETKISKN